jgi:hypothetical protein
MSVDTDFLSKRMSLCGNSSIDIVLLAIRAYPCDDIIILPPLSNIYRTLDYF